MILHRPVRDDAAMTPMRRRAFPVGGALAAAAVLSTAAPALAATLVGTDRPDNLVGTSRGDGMRGLAGSDLIRGRGGRDTIWGGRGDDRIVGGRVQDFLSGGPGRDYITGGRGNDSINGRGDGPDVLVGNGDHDSIFASRRDVVYAGRGGDVVVVYTSGVFIDCGPGEDQVGLQEPVLDITTRGCEHIDYAPY